MGWGKFSPDSDGAEPGEGGLGVNYSSEWHEMRLFCHMQKNPPNKNRVNF
jgi:hypothetical protein